MNRLPLFRHLPPGSIAPFVGTAILLEVTAAIIGIAACYATARPQLLGTWHRAATGLYVLSLTVAVLGLLVPAAPVCPSC